LWYREIFPLLKAKEESTMSGYTSINKITVPQSAKGVLSSSGIAGELVESPTSNDLAVLGTADTSGNMAFMPLTAGAGIELTNSGTDYNVTQTHLDEQLYTPQDWDHYQTATTSSSSDLVISSTVTAYPPTLAGMQTLATLSFTPELVGSNLRIFGTCYVANTTVSTQTNVVLALFVNGTLLSYIPYDMPASFAPISGMTCSILANYTSQNTATTTNVITFTLAIANSPNYSATTSSNPTVASTSTTSIAGGGAAAATIIVDEMPQTSPGIISENIIAVPTTHLTASPTTIITQTGLYKQFTNTLLEVELMLPAYVVGDGSFSVTPVVTITSTYDNSTSSITLSPSNLSNGLAIGGATAPPSGQWNTAGYYLGALAGPNIGAEFTGEYTITLSANYTYGAVNAVWVNGPGAFFLVREVSQEANAGTVRLNTVATSPVQSQSSNAGTVTNISTKGTGNGSGVNFICRGNDTVVRIKGFISCVFANTGSTGMEKMQLWVGETCFWFTYIQFLSTEGGGTATKSVSIPVDLIVPTSGTGQQLAIYLEGWRSNTGLSPMATFYGSFNVREIFNAASFGANNATVSTSWEAMNFSIVPFTNITVPITQTITSATAPTYNSSTSGTTGNFMNSNTANVNYFLNVSVQMSTDINWGSAPPIIAFAIYLKSNSNLVNGDSAYAMKMYQFPTVTSGTGTYRPTTLKFRVAVPQTFIGNYTYFSVTPYIYLPSGTLTGTNLLIGNNAGASQASNIFFTYSGSYSNSAPVGAQDFLITNKGLSTFTSQNITVNGVANATGQWPLATNSINPTYTISTSATKEAGEPSVFWWDVQVPFTMSVTTTGTGVATNYASVYVGIYVGTQLASSSEKAYVFPTAGTFVIEDVLNYTSYPNTWQPNSVVTIQAVYSYNNATTTVNYCYIYTLGQAQTLMCNMYAALQSYTQATGSLHLLDMAYEPATTLGTTVTLSTTPIYVGYGNSQTSISYNTNYLISSQTITPDFIQSSNMYQAEVTFQTNLTGGSGISLGVLIYAKPHGTSTSSYQMVGFGISPDVNNPTGQTFFTTVTAQASFNSVNSAYDIAVCGAIITSGTTAPGVTVTSLLALGTSSSTTFGGMAVSTTTCEVASLANGVSSGSSSSANVSIIGASGSYIDTSTAGGVVTINTQQASNGQPGLVVSTTSAAPNTVVRTNNSGVTVSSTMPAYPSFGSALRVYFGGSATGQVVGNQYGEAVYRSAAISTAATGLATVSYNVEVLFSINVTTKGTSTGVATIQGMPVMPAGGAIANGTQFLVGQYAGITIPNGTLLYFYVIPGSTSLGIYYYTINNNTFTQLTNSNFATAFALRCIIPVLPTLTAPTN